MTKEGFMQINLQSIKSLGKLIIVHSVDSHVLFSKRAIKILLKRGKKLSSIYGNSLYNQRVYCIPQKELTIKEGLRINPYYRDTNGTSKEVWNKYIPDMYLDSIIEFLACGSEAQIFRCVYPDFGDAVEKVSFKGDGNFDI